MSGWVKLHLVVEGDTELLFARDTLKPHLHHFRVSLDPFKLMTNSKVGASGGALSWDRFRHNVSGILKKYSTKSDHFSTMIDWYKLDPKFPGLAESRRLAKATDRASSVAQAVREHFGSRRFLPFFMLHEFEALLFCDLSTVAQRMPDLDSAIARLGAEIGSTPPEEVDDGPDTHPSARLKTHLPDYDRVKVRVGAPAAGQIGLPTLRQRCPHFGRWLADLEGLAEAADYSHAIGPN